MWTVTPERVNDNTVINVRMYSLGLYLLLRYKDLFFTLLVVGKCEIRERFLSKFLKSRAIRIVHNFIIKNAVITFQVYSIRFEFL